MKIRVLEVLATLRRAGAERVAVSLTCGLDRERFETAVVSLYPRFPGGFECDLEGCGSAVWHLGKRRGFDPRMWPRLAAAMDRFRPQIVHTHSYVLRYVWPSSWFRRAAIVHTVHNVAEREVDRLGRCIHRLVFRSGGVPVAISNRVANSFESVYGFRPVVIPNGADTRSGFVPGAREGWRKQHGFRDDDLLIVSLARLEQQKNPIGLIEAFGQAFAERNTAHLIMAGEGALLESARARAAALGMADRVHFLGLCQDVPQLLSAVDIFALASHWEGAPVSILEAMAACLPVVATAVGGVPDLVEDGVTGLLVSPREPGALARALATLADAAARQRMGEAAARRAACFDTAAMVQSYSALFDEVSR